MFRLKFVYIYLAGRVAAAESTRILSGTTLFAESVTAGATVLVLTAAVESVLPDDIEDSLVPQLTTTIPKPKAANNNFFIIFYFSVIS